MVIVRNILSRLTILRQLNRYCFYKIKQVKQFYIQCVRSCLYQYNSALLSAYNRHPAYYKYLLYFSGGLLIQHYLIKPYAGEIKTYKDYSYMVAGMGRCGTTSLHNSIYTDIRSCVPHAKPIALYQSYKYIINFPRITPNFVIKVHSPDPNSFNMPDNVKVIWLFGNPYNIVIASVKSIMEHYMHMESPHWNKHKHIFTYDTLMLETHFDAWYRPQKFGFISVRYESLFKPETIDFISDFLGWKLSLPAFRKRKTDWHQHARRADLERTYGRLNTKMLAAEDFKLWEATEKV